MPRATLLAVAALLCLNLSAIGQAVSPEEVDGQVDRARAGLAAVRDGLAGARGARREVDTLDLRANLIEHALRVADMCAPRSIGAGDDAAYFASVRARAAAYAEARAESFAADLTNSQGFAIPRPDLLAPWRVEHGELTVGGEPTVLCGFVWQYSTKDLSYSLYDLGMNFQSLDTGPQASVPTPYEPVTDPRGANYIRSMRAAMEAGQNWGEAFEIHTSPHYLPKWFEADLDPNNALMETDEFRRLIDLHYRTLREAYGDLAAAKVADLANEWTFRSTSPEAMAGFAVWLRARYGSVEALDQAWGSELGDFEAVPAPFGDGGDTPADLYQSRAPYWDWCCYNAERAAEVVRWMDADLKLRYPGLLTHIKCVLSSYGYRSLADSFALGIDPERILPITDLIGTDASYIFGGEWVRTLFAYDYLRSICPDKPIFCSESHMPFQEYARPAPQIRRGLFQRFIHGERLNLVFLNVTTQVPDYWTTGEGPRWNFSQDPEVLESLALTSADLRRIAPLLVPFGSQPPSVLLFYDNVADFAVPGSQELPGAYAERAMAAYESLLGRDVKVGIVTEKMLTDGRSPSAPLIVLTGAAHMSDAVVAALAQYAASGGHVLLLGENLTHDPYGRVREAASRQAVLDQPSVRALPPPNGPDGYGGLWDEQLTWAGVDCPFVLANAGGDGLPHVELLSAEGPDGSPLVFVANGQTDAVACRLRPSQGDEQAFTDVITGQAVDASALRLEPDEVYLLQGRL